MSVAALGWSVAAFAAAPANDNFANRAVLSGMVVTATGSNVSATKETGEPNHAGYAGGNSVWWTWTAPATGSVSLDTSGSSFSSTVAVYTGTAVNSLTAVADDPDGGTRYTSRQTFKAISGTVYQIAVDTSNGGTGTISLSLRLPGNDSFDSGFTLKLFGATTKTITTVNTGTTKEAFEPSHGGNAGGKSVWWSWTAPYNGTVTLSTAGSNFDTLLAVYTGNSLGAGLTLVAGNDNDGVNTTSKVTFSAVSGQTYRLAVDGLNGASGSITLGFEIVAPNDTFANRILLTGTHINTNGFNTGTSKETGEPNHAGNAGGKSVWWSWTAPYSGKVTITTSNTTGNSSTGSEFDTLLGVYTGTAVNALTAKASNRAGNGYSSVNFDVVGGTTYQIAVDGYNAATGKILLQVALAPPNDLFANRIALTGLPVNATGTIDGATFEPGDYVFNFAYGNSVWWKWTAPSSGYVQVSTVGSGFNAALAVFTGTALNALTLVGKNENTNSPGVVAFNATSGTVYTILVDSQYSGPFAVNLAITSPPHITNQPGAIGVTAGATAPFDFTVTGTDLTFQWQESRGGQFGTYVDLQENSVYSGVQTLNLRVTTVSTMNNYWYRCVINFTGGPLITDAVQLTVNDRKPAIVTSPVNQAIVTGQTAVFTATFDADPAPTYQWLRKANGAGTFSNLAEGGNYTGTTTGTLSVNNATLAMSGDQFYCIASNNGGDASSTAASLSVTNPIATTFSLNKTSFTYSGSAQGPTVVPSPVGATFVTGGTVTATNVGNYTATATANGGYAGTNNALAWQITKASQPAPVITSAASVTLGNAYTATATTGFGALSWALGTGSTATGAAINATTGAVTATGTGLVRIKAKYAGDANHNASAFSADFTVTVNAPVNPASARADFNADLKSDILWSNNSTGERSVWFMNGSVYLGGTSLGVVPVAWTISAVNDFNGDGQADIFLSNTSTGDRAVWVMNGTTIATNAFLGTIPTNWVVSTTGDFNGDGKADVFWTDTATGNRAVWLMNGGAYIGGGFTGTVPVAWVVSGTGDFNADGKADILWSNTTTGERAVWFMNGSNYTGGTSLGVVPVAWTISAVNDFNGDGKTDIFLSNTSTGDRAVWVMNGTAIATNAFLGTIPTNWVISTSGDYNGDGKADVFWTDTATGNRAVWLMNGGAYIGGGFAGTVPVAWVAK